MSTEVFGIKLGEKFKCQCGRTHEVYTKRAVVGYDAIFSVPKILDEIELTGNAIIIHDEITKKIAGDKLIQLLRQNGFAVDEYLTTRPTISEVDKLHQIMKNFRFALAVGGGSVIDTCKLASYKADIPFISIPTALSHDGIVSATSSIITEKGSKESFLAKSPIAVIFDLRILKEQPKRMLAAGCGDMLARATSLKDWELAMKDVGEYYCPTIAKLVLETYNETINFIQSDGRDIANFSWAILGSGIAMAMMGSSRPNSGSEHIISHYIDKHSENPAMHGEQVGFATILMSLYHSKYNSDWWTDNNYQWYTIKKMLEKMNAPVTTEKLGIETEVVINALNEGYRLRPERYTILHKRPVPRDEALFLLKAAGLLND